jgi:predicted NAD/FAD-dependent oxidoreductase
MDVGVIGAGIAGLAAAWHLRREGHRVRVFEKNYKAGGRMNSRRKAGLIVDHGDRFIERDSPSLRELIVDCGLQGESQLVESPIYSVDAAGAFTLVQAEPGREKIVFPDGMLALPEALRRSLGGFYSIAVTGVERDDVLQKYVVRTDPPLRITETQVDAVIVACAAPGALSISQSFVGHLNPEFVERLKRVQYNRCLTLIAATNGVALSRPIYGLYPPPGPDAVLKWIALEDQKCEARAVEGWHSLVAHATPEKTEELWDLEESEIIEILHAEIRRFLPELPEAWRWARVKRWEIARLKSADDIVPADQFPSVVDDSLVAFCGDYRLGDGVEAAALSGKLAAQRLIHKMRAKGL